MVIAIKIDVKRKQQAKLSNEQGREPGRVILCRCTILVLWGLGLGGDHIIVRVYEVGDCVPRLSVQ